MADWYYAENDAQRGPVSREQLVQLIEDLVWTDTMANWTPAAEVPGLIPGETASPYLAAEPAREEEYEEPRGTWESLSPGAKAGIVTGIGGGFVAFVFILVVVILARQHQPPGSPEKSDQDKVTTKATKPADSTAAAKPAKPPEPITTVPDFDPKKLTSPEEKEAYREGCEQGGHILNRQIKAVPTDATKEQILQSVKGWLKERDAAIIEGIHFDGMEALETIRTFGRRDGLKVALKDWLKQRGLSMPEKW
jgi:hypothetical protein